MKTAKKQRRKLIPRLGPSGFHVLELIMGVLIITGGQGLLVSLVHADPDITPPSVPSNLVLDGRSATTVDFHWDASTDDVAVTGYNVYRNGTLVGSPASTSFSDTGLTPSNAYIYTISAVDAVPNESAQSSALNVSTLADTTPPSIPSNLHQTGATTSTISIAWNASSDNVGVTNYEIYRNGLLIRTQAGTTYTDTNLAVYTSYTYTITAQDAAGNYSNLSQPLFAATAQDVTPPSVPDNTVKTGSTISTIDLSWDASTDDIGVAGYRVYRDGVLVGSPGGTTFTDTGLSVSSNYTYTIRAIDAANNLSAYSAPYSTSSSNDTTPPSTPTNLHTTNVLDNAVDLDWDNATDDVAVTGYKIYRDGLLVGTSPSSSFTDSALSPATDYDYTVRAYDAASNDSPASAVLDVQTAYDTTAPSVPDNLIATDKTDTTITLGWDVATDNIMVDGYDVYRDGVLITSTVGTNFVDTGLEVETSYTYRVRARDSSGNNSALSSQLITVTLPDEVAPSAPTGLNSSTQTTTSIDLSWNPAADDVAVASYNVYRDGNFVANVGSTAYSDSNLQYDHDYIYEVRTVDTSNNESVASSALPVSTLPDTIAPNVAITTPAHTQTYQLTFPISATASDDLDLALVEVYANASPIAIFTAPPFSFNWNSYAVHNGWQTISVKAYDASGNSSTHSVSIYINNPPPPLTGDINGDHKVNIFDLSLLLSRWNKSGAGDFNNNGRIDIFDLSVLLSRFGQDNSNYS